MGWRDDYHRELEAAMARGAALGRRMEGLSVGDAQALADTQDEFAVEFVDADEPLTADLRATRLRALTRDGVVVSADPG